MANLNEKSRKEQVLDRLRLARHERLGWQEGWVNTVDISNAACGGSAGTSRIRDLRKEGYVIETRPHPDPQISQYQYRLVSEPVLGAKGGALPTPHPPLTITVQPEADPVQQKVWD